MFFVVVFARLPARPLRSSQTHCAPLSKDEPITSAAQSAVACLCVCLSVSNCAEHLGDAGRQNMLKNTNTTRAGTTSVSHSPKSITPLPFGFNHAAAIERRACEHARTQYDILSACHNCAHSYDCESVASLCRRRRRRSH